MRKNIAIGFMFLIIFLVSCNKEKLIIKRFEEYNAIMKDKGYYFGDKIILPSYITRNAESISISFGDKESDFLTIDPKYFILGENDITFKVKMRDGKVINQDVRINVLSSKQEQKLDYEEITEYPHDPTSFVQGFQLEGNIIYESDGKFNQSRMIKYKLGQTEPIAEAIPTPDAGTLLVEKIFSEGSALVGEKVFQLDWKNKIGFIYGKSNLEKISQFEYSSEMKEGWGLTYDGKNLIASDGSSNIFFLDIDDPSKVVRKIGVADSKMSYNQINELEYHNGFIYANVWQKPIILKIDPCTGEVIGIYDFSKYAKLHTKGSDDVLNGIAFKGDNMLITGKNWPKIYEVQLK